MAINHIEDFFSTTLSSGITAGANSMVLVAAPTSYPCYLVLDATDATLREIVKVSSIAGTTCTLETRGVGSTSAGAHSAGCAVTMNPVSSLWTDLDTAITSTTVGHDHDGTDSKFIDNLGIKLLNDGYLLGLNNAGDDTVNILKVNASDQVEFGAAVAVGAYDFFVDTDTFFVDASENRVGINKVPTQYPLEVTYDTIAAAFYGSGDTGTAYVNINAMPGEATDEVIFRIFRSTETSGDTSIQVYKGNNSTTVNHRLYGQGGDSSLCIDNGILTIGSMSGNAKMTRGLTIDQKASDDEILACKSSDVAQSFTDYAEADTYGSFRKAAATTGGLDIRAFSESAITFQFGAYAAGSLGTTKTTSGRGVFEMAAYYTDGSTGVTDCGADANLLVLRNNATTRHIFDIDGDYKAFGAISAVDSVSWGSNATSTVAKCRAYSSSEQTDITDATPTKVVFGTEEYDIGSNFATSTFTAPVASYYRITAQVALDDVVDCPCYLFIYKNGADLCRAQSEGDERRRTMNISTTALLAAEDTIDIYVQANTGPAPAAQADIETGAGRTYVCIEMI